MRWERVGPWDSLVSEMREPGAPTVVLFHGYGADASDLAPFADVFAALGPWRWVFPNGVREVPLGPFFTGRAWFPIDMAEVERAMMAGTYRNFKNTRPQGLDGLIADGLRFVESLQVAPEQLVLGGFSQGAMLATELSLRLKTPPAGLMILSGTLADEATIAELLAKKPQLRFLQSHGDRDPILDPAAARDLFNLLVAHGAEGEFVGFAGAHEIPRVVQEKMALFLKACLPSKTHA